MNDLGGTGGIRLEGAPRCKTGRPDTKEDRFLESGEWISIVFLCCLGVLILCVGLWGAIYLCG